MGTSGGQPGNNNGTKNRRWAEAIDKALKQYTDKKRKIEAGQALDRIARNLVKLALDGDLWANQEIGNRLDGKAAQSLEVSGSIAHKHVHELTDDQLATLAAGGSLGTAETSESSQDPTGVH